MEEARKKGLSEILHIISADSREIIQNPLHNVLQTGEIQGLASRTLLVSKQGKEHFIADSASPIQDEDGHIHGMILVFRDVTREEMTRRMMEKRLELEDYSLFHELDQVLTKVLDEVEALVDSRISFYHFVHADQETLTLQQWSTRTLREFCSVEAKGQHYPINEAGIWVDCVHNKEPIIHNDYASAPHKKGLPQGHPEVSRELVVPVLRENKIVAFLGVGNKPHEYTEMDKEIVSFFADVTWEIVLRKQAEQRASEVNCFLHSTLNSLTYHIAVLDEQGEIILVNQAWREFAEESGISADAVSEGVNYLQVCSHAAQAGDKGAESFAAGIRSVISGESDLYSQDYPCHSPQAQRWFIGRVAPFSAAPNRRVVISHVEITERKLTEQELRKNEEELGAAYENAPLIMLLVDGDRKVRKANAYASEFLGKSLEGLEGDLVGSALNCVHAHEANPESGNGSPCAQCIIRNTVQETLRTQQATHHVEVNLGLVKQGHTTEHTFLLSTAPLLENRHEPRVLVSLMDITEQKESEKKLRRISFHDALTGLYNRNFFQEEMERLSDRRFSPIGIIVCDLDGLKLVNDTLGHQSGDQLLIHAADLLHRNLRSSDILARIGGDEFAVLLPQTSREVVGQILQRLRRGIEDHNSQDPRLPLSISLGSAVSENGEPDLHDLFREADNLMYREKIQQKESPRSSIVQVLTRSMQARDFQTEGHCDRLQELTSCFSQTLGLSHDVENDLALLARFHDLGKVGIPDHILFKPERLTEEEWQQMRRHCEIGHQIASTVPDLEPIADLILKHHEQWDGRGYPQGLSGREIPLSCRILAIVDAYDAMVSDRPYRKAMSKEDALVELKGCSGTQFDPELVEWFVEVVDSCEESCKSLAGSN